MMIGECGGSPQEAKAPYHITGVSKVALDIDLWSGI